MATGPIINEDAHLLIHYVSRCGFYRRSTTSRHVFGTLQHTLRDLETWASGLPSLGQRVASDGRRNAAPLGYLVDIRRHGGDWLLVIWNPVPTRDGKVPSIPLDAPLGGTKVHLNPVTKGTVAGYATYFFVMPQEELVVGVRFEGRTYGFTQFSHFVQGFLRWHSPHAVVTGQTPSGEYVVAGYARNPAQDTPDQLYGAFRTELRPLQGPRHELLARADQIERIVHKATINTLIPANRGRLQRILSLVDLDEASVAAHEADFRLQVDANFSTDSLRSFLKRWDREAQEREQGDDVGFFLSGEMGKPRWLNRMLPRTQLDVNIQRHDGELVDASTLVRALHLRRDYIARVATHGPEE